MKIYTKTGDQGTTSLFGGARVPKNHLRIESYGTVDELNCHIGLLISYLSMDDVEVFLLQIQHKLFNIGSCLAIDPKSDIVLPGVTQQDVDILEQAMDQYNTMLPELKNFILPGGNIANAQSHVCRTVCRRAERKIISLSLEDTVDQYIIIYLNRLSDYFFVLSRYISLNSNTPEVLWKS